MKKLFFIGLIGLMGFIGTAELQAQSDNPSKRERKKNLIVREWNQNKGAAHPIWTMW